MLLLLWIVLVLGNSLCLANLALARMNTRNKQQKDLGRNKMKTKVGFKQQIRSELLALGNELLSNSDI